MVLTDSIKLYEVACKYGKQQNQSGHLPGQHNGYGYNNYGATYSRSNSSHIDLETYYIQIIGTMFFELITKKNSGLLSLLCAVNEINVDVANFNTKFQRYNFKSTYDLFPLLVGLNAAFTKGLSECSYVYSKYGKDIFQGKSFSQGYEYVTAVTDELQTLDDNIGRCVSASSQSVEKPKRKEEVSEPKKSKAPDTILRIHAPELTDKLNQLAENRRANDSAISEQIQALQVSLQDELKQIMAIREGIDYNLTQEAINQFISLFTLLSETLIYHPNNENKDSYTNLVESCEDFLENIKQSLAMLGVAIINDVGKPFDPEKHKTVRGVQPTRMATISKVVKIGFAYKNKVLEKAEVELA